MRKKKIKLNYYYFLPSNKIKNFHFLICFWCDNATTLIVSVTTIYVKFHFYLTKLLTDFSLSSSNYLLFSLIILYQISLSFTLFPVSFSLSLSESISSFPTQKFQIKEEAWKPCTIYIICPPEEERLSGIRGPRHCCCSWD